MLGRDGCIYGIPAHADAVLKIDPQGGRVSLLGQGLVGSGRWKWHGAALGADGAIYGIPCNAEGVLRIEPETSQASSGGW